VRRISALQNTRAWGSGWKCWVWASCKLQEIIC